MKVIQLPKKKDLNLKEYVKRSAREDDYATLIKEPCICMDGDRVVIIYDHFDGDTRGVVSALRKIRYQVGLRTRGLKSTSRILGYRPRVEMRQDYCSATSLAAEQPHEHEVVCDLALKLEDYYKKYNPEGYAKHKEMTEGKVKKEWRIGKKSIFTSGIINKNNPLKYHFDTGNFSEVYSMMIVFKGGVDGGYLSLPEYDVGFELPNNSLFMFDGQGILHGVTPIRKKFEWSYRFSVVYCTLKRMWQCLEIDEEVARIRKVKTGRERTRMDVPLTEAERLEKEKKRKMRVCNT